MPPLEEEKGVVHHKSEDETRSSALKLSHKHTHEHIYTHGTATLLVLPLLIYGGAASKEVPGTTSRIELSAYVFEGCYEQPSNSLLV